MPNAEKLERKGADKAKNPEKLEEKAALRALSKVDDHIQKAFKNGSWAYKPGDAACVEPTAYCGIARRKDGAARKQVIEFLSASQNKDGGWSTSPGLGKSDWTSGLALLALRILLKEEGSIDPACRSLLDNAVKFLFEERFELFGPYLWLAKPMVKFNEGEEGLNWARGWPWSQGAFHWVEPTVYALLALKIPGPVEAKDSQNVLMRGDKFLLEHACKDGGWNHGNDLCLNVHLPPFAVTTAEALIALQNENKANVVKKAFHNLSKTIGYNKSAMSLAWVSIAQQSHGKDSSESIAALIDRQNDDGSFGPDLMVTAISMLALQAHLGDNALKVS
ncbi:MAG: hypothetical protein IT342_02815 [Candidatus Melainabacteria bacterium]|nr:hypothetical protein [Candidatus Melainabacteria bacterium]